MKFYRLEFNKWHDDDSVEIKPVEDVNGYFCLKPDVEQLERELAVTVDELALSNGLLERTIEESDLLKKELAKAKAEIARLRTIPLPICKY